MGVDYDAKAGYGVKIKNNLTEEYQTIMEEKYDNNIYEFVENELSNFTYSSAETFLNPVIPSTFPFSSNSTTKGKLPSLLYFSANFLLISVCSDGN